MHHDRLHASSLLQQAEEILEIALRGDQDVAIVLEAGGAIRMLDPTGWSLPALAAESGAEAVFKVERRAGALRVEGWDGTERCLIQRPLGGAARLHHPLQRCGVNWSGEERFQQPVFGDSRGRLAIGEREAHDLAILRYPDLVDQPVLHGVVGVFQGDSYHPVAKREYYTL